MTAPDPDIRAVLRHAEEALAAATTHLRLVGAALALVRTAFEHPAEAASRAPAPPADAAAEHRRAHRPGHPARIDSDPELRAFILARIDGMTFEALAAEVAAHFPEPRRVRKSAIHRWWQANRRLHPPGRDNPSDIARNSPRSSGITALELRSRP